MTDTALSRASTRVVWRIVLAYVLTAGLWILLSDPLLELCVPNADIRLPWSMVKGWGFVLATGALLACLLRRELQIRERAEEALNQTHQELEQRVQQRTAELAAARDRAEAADRTKSTFLATMSHELRTPLNSVIGFTSLLLQGLAGPLNDEQRKQLGMVRASGQHLLALINDVLDLSKIEADQIEIDNAPFDLPASLRKVIRSMEPLAAKKGLSLIVQVGAEVGEIRSDPRRVEQVLMNLLSNAVKFTDRGEIRLTADIVSGEARIAVSDTGLGIRAEDRDKLFQPFRQLDGSLARCHEGTGLGLAICKRLLDRLGGSIAVESQYGTGSTFRVTLPVRGQPTP